MSEIICIQCQSIGKPKRRKQGSTKLEVIGWLMFPLGLPYTIWRILAARTPVCRHCGAESLLAVDSVAGQRLVKIATGEISAKAPAKAGEPSASVPIQTIKPPKSNPDPGTW